MPTHRVYLAGPDVFLPDPLTQSQRKKDILSDLGMEGVFPLDSHLQAEDYSSPFEFGRAIALGNEVLMNGCQAILANLTPWHGPEADSGTCFEVGYMRAQGKIIAAYSNDSRPFFDRVKEDVYSGEIKKNSEGFWVGKTGMTLENFDTSENIMLAHAALNSSGIFEMGKMDISEAAYYTDLSSFYAAAQKLAAHWHKTC